MTQSLEQSEVSLSSLTGEQFNVNSTDNRTKWDFLNKMQGFNLRCIFKDPLSRR